MFNFTGETPLHLACISGKLEQVRRLLDHGHPVNIRDNCGWLPIHEACNFGRKDIVEILVAKGASINDRGGSGCTGMTPLHDACCNGHLDVIEYLLDCNASAVTQNDSGETPLQVLKTYRENVKLDPIKQTHYETIVARMTTILQKARLAPITNQNKPTTPNKIRVLPITQERKKHTPTKNYPSFSKVSPLASTSKSRRTSLSSDDSHSSKKIKSPRGQPIGTLRYMIDNGSSDDEMPMSSAKERLKNRTAEVSSSLHNLQDESNSNDSSNDYEISAGNEYKRLMENLRNRSAGTTTKSNQTDQSKRSAYVTQNEFGDNWLENDVSTTRPTKKRRFGNVKQNFIDTNNTRKSNSPKKRLSDPSCVNSFTEARNSFCDENDIQILSSDFDERLDNSNDSFSSNNSSKRKKSQWNLFDSGFSRNSASPEPTFSRTLSSSSINRSFKRQQKISTFTVPSAVLTPDSTTCSVDSHIIPVVPPMNRSMYAITVRIENTLWRIPVPANEIDNLTIGWLANEAAKRYYRLEFICAIICKIFIIMNRFSTKVDRLPSFS